MNAKNHEREAEIIAEAGHKGSVTIATNMAGRGTDIKLGEGVVDLVDLPLSVQNVMKPVVLIISCADVLVVKGPRCDPVLFINGR